MVEEIDLLEDPGPAVPGHLVDDLDGVLHLGVDVDAGLDDGVGALAEYLASQPVQLLEGVRGQGGRAGSLLLLPPAGLGCLLTGGDRRGPVILVTWEGKGYSRTK